MARKKRVRAGRRPGRRGATAESPLLRTARECLRAGEDARAAMVLDQAVRAAPRDAEARGMLEAVASRLGRPSLAVPALDAAALAAPDDVEVHRAHGRVLRAAGRVAAAAQSLERACAMDAGDAGTCNELGLALLDLGRFEAAAERFREALRLDAAVPGAGLNLARTRRFTSVDEPDAVLIRGLLDVHRDPLLLSDVHFGLAKVHDDCGLPAPAFAHLREANRLVRSTVGHDREAHARSVDALIETFDAALLARGAALGEPSGRPVFVVGMPRSGTTLVEQILASHPAVFGAGELDLVDRLSHDLRRRLGTSERYPRCAAGMRADVASACGRAYLEQLPVEAAGAARVTDKMPGNFLHLGFIALVLPGARIVHCRRDPMDTGFSIYAQQFESGHAWGYDLEDIAHFHREYERLMTHWQAVLPLPLHEIRYERLVHEPEEEVRRMVEFLGLPWDARCLAFHETERAVGTASNWQVRQPLHAAAIGRWRRYACDLEPLRRALAAGEPVRAGSARS